MSLLVYKTRDKFYIVIWHRQKLSVALQQKKLLVLENEMQQQRKVLKVEVENVRINSFF